MKPSLIAAALVVTCLASIAPACEGEVREGIHLRFPSTPENQVLVSCWPVTIVPGTVLLDVNGDPFTLESLTAESQLRATGCLDVDGFTLIANSLTLLNPGPPAGTTKTSDIQVALGNSGASSWFVSSATDPNLAPTGAANANPVLMLEVGKRYTFSYAFPTSHPFAIIAAGATSAGDQVLLVVGSSIGTMEADAAVAWEDNGTDFSFTVTPALAAAMEGDPTQGPGYRCDIHRSMMRGAVMLMEPASAKDWLLYQ